MFDYIVLGNMIATMSTKGDLLLVFLKEGDYVKKVRDVLRTTSRHDKRVCYVCLSKPYNDTLEDLKKNEIDIEKVFFIDVLTSHYKAPEPKDNCIFLGPDDDLFALIGAIGKAIQRHDCETVVFDAISTLFARQESVSVMKFTNQLVKEEGLGNADKLFLFFKNGDEAALGDYSKDLEMFASKKLDMR